MAKMIPDINPAEITEQDKGKKAERKVYEWFMKDDIPGYCFYSYLQDNHLRKRIGEVDFIYICDNGILCLEVKGGKITCKDKIYKSNENIIKDPYKQVTDCMFALERLLSSNNIENYSLLNKNINLAYGVIFPDCKLADECDFSDYLFDTRYDIKDFPNYLKRIFKICDEKWKNTIPKFYQPEILNKEAQEKIVNFLKYDFGCISSMKFDIQNIEDKMIQLTDNQLEVFYGLDENKRIIVKGGPGTGKTLIAMEKIRIALKENKRVLYICFNSNMAQYVSMQFQANDKLKICTLHNLLQNYFKEKFDTPSPEIISKKFIQTPIEELIKAKNKDIVKYDVLIVDEAQDLMYSDVWTSLNLFLEGGIEEGEWIVFTDHNQSIFVDKNKYLEGFEFLKAFGYNPTIYTLRKNWRNTTQIMEKTIDLTGINSTDITIIDGPPVVINEICDLDDIKNKLVKDIKELLDSGIKTDYFDIKIKKLINS